MKIAVSRQSFADLKSGWNKPNGFFSEKSVTLPVAQGTVVITKLGSLDIYNIYTFHFLFNFYVFYEIL